MSIFLNGKVISKLYNYAYNYATKADFKKVTSVDISKFAKRVEWCRKEWSCQNNCIWLTI